jgi:predicted TIM-barrel fold metal-dependent hydrolase
MIIDAHIHFDEHFDGTVAGSSSEIARQMREAGINHVIALHLEFQPWSPEEVAAAISPHPGIHAFVNIHPHKEGAKQKLLYAVEQLGFIGLKLHPRLQEHPVDSEATIELVRYAGQLGVPVLIDAFPDGTHLMQGFEPLRYAVVARECPGTRIIWAHMGGHFVLDFMMLAKRLPNVYMDMSYSLLYFRGSSVPMNMVYAMRSMRFDRIFYGSDYPDRSLRESLQSSIEVLRANGVGEPDLHKLLAGNACQFFGWSES